MPDFIFVREINILGSTSGSDPLIYRSVSCILVAIYEISLCAKTFVFLCQTKNQTANKSVPQRPYDHCKVINFSLFIYWFARESNIQFSLYFYIFLVF